MIVESEVNGSNCYEKHTQVERRPIQLGCALPPVLARHPLGTVPTMNTSARWRSVHMELMGKQYGG
jgi:hypothetical protein